MKRIIVMRVGVALLATLLAERLPYRLTHKGMVGVPPRRGKHLFALLGLKQRIYRRGKGGFSGTGGVMTCHF